MSPPSNWSNHSHTRDPLYDFLGFRRLDGLLEFRDRGFEPHRGPGRSPSRRQSNIPRLLRQKLRKIASEKGLYSVCSAWSSRSRSMHDSNGTVGTRVRSTALLCRSRDVGEMRSARGSIEHHAHDQVKKFAERATPRQVIAHHQPATHAARTHFSTSSLNIFLRDRPLFD